MIGSTKRTMDQELPMSICLLPHERIAEANFTLLRSCASKSLTDSPRSEEESVPEQRPMVITPLDGSAVQQNFQRHCYPGHELSAGQMR